MRRKLYIQALLFLWSVISLCFFVKNSFANGYFIPITFIEALLSLIALNFSAYFFGKKFLAAIKIKMSDDEPAALYKIAVGYGAIFIFLTLFGLLYCYKPIPLTLFLIFLTASAGFGINDFMKASPLKNAECPTIVQALLFALTLFVVALAFFTALVPPTERDAIIHHLAAPKIYLKQGGLAPLNFISYSFRSINLELLYLLALFIKNDIIAKVIHFNFYLLSIFAIYALIKSSFSKNSALLSAFLFASIPVVFNTASRAYVDMGLAFFSIMLLIVALRYYKTGDKTYVILAGIMSGLVISTKINGGLLVALVFLWIISITQRKKESLKRLLMTIGTFLLFALIFNIHLIAKNTIHTGSPLRPMLSSAGIGKGTKTLLPAEMRKILYNHTVADEILTPWALSTDVESKALYTVDGVLGPVFIIFVPFIFLIKRKRYELLSLFAIAAIYTVICWGMTVIRLRYLFPIFPIGFFLFSAVIEEFFSGNGEPESRIKKIPNALLIIILFLLTSLNLYHIFDYLSIKEPFAFLSSKMSKEEYIAKHYKEYQIFKYINENIADKKALIYFLDFGNDGYYCDADYFYDTDYLGDTLYSIIKGSASANDARNELSKRGFTHILVNNIYLNDDIKNNYIVQEQAVLYDFMRNYLLPLKTIGDDTVYEIKKE